MTAIQVHDGRVAPELAAEFPGLRLSHATCAVRPGPSPPAVRQRLRQLSDRDRGAGVVALRTRPVPSAYRTFFRQIGLDPDVRRIPAEAVAVARLLHGGLRSEGLVPDACRIALVETGVPVWALSAGARENLGHGAHGGHGGDDRQVRRLEIRAAVAGERGEEAAELRPGSLVVADEHGVQAILFGDPLPGRGVGAGSRAATVYAIAVDGVPEIHLQEAMWTALDLLGAAVAG